MPPPPASLPTPSATARAGGLGSGTSVARPCPRARSHGLALGPSARACARGGSDRSGRKSTAAPVRESARLPPDSPIVTIAAPARVNPRRRPGCSYEPPYCQALFPLPFQFQIERVVVAVLWSLWARGPKGSSTNPQDPPGSRHGRNPGIPFQAATDPASPCRAVTLFFSCCRNGLAPFGDAPGRTSRFLGALNVASILLSGSVWPTAAGPVTLVPDSGRCDVPGGGTHLE